MEPEKRTEQAINIASAIIGLGLTWAVGILAFSLTPDGQEVRLYLPPLAKTFFPFLLMGSIFFGFSALIGIMGLLEPAKKNTRVVTVQDPTIRLCLFVHIISNCALLIGACILLMN